MRDPKQVTIGDKVFTLNPMKARAAGEFQRKLGKVIIPLLGGIQAMQSVGDLGSLPMDMLTGGLQQALTALPDAEFDTLLLGMCKYVSTTIEGKGVCTLHTGDLVDAAIDKPTDLYILMFEIARYNEFLPFALLGDGSATPGTLG